MAIFLMSLATQAMADAPKLYAPDGTYLGKLTTDKYDPESITNPYGDYGSKYSQNSIHNKYGTYGSPYSDQSPKNLYVDDDGNIIIFQNR